MSVTINGSGSITGVSTLTGNIGINTNPVKTLHVNATAENQYAIARISGRNRGGQLEFCTDATKTSGMYSPTSTDALVFFTGAAETEAARFNSSGNLAFPSGQGIDFSATSDGSGTTTSELLDDYEEGTWTPVLAGESTAGTWTPDAATSGIYTKIGNIVYCQMTCSGTLAGAAGLPTVLGLPFTVASSASVGGNAVFASGSLQYWDGSGANFMGPLTEQSSNFLYFHSYDGDSSGNTNISNGSHALYCCVTYRVA